MYSRGDECPADTALVDPRGAGVHGLEHTFHQGYSSKPNMCAVCKYVNEVRLKYLWSSNWTLVKESALVTQAAAVFGGCFLRMVSAHSFHLL